MKLRYTLHNGKRLECEEYEEEHEEEYEEEHEEVYEEVYEEEYGVQLRLESADSLARSLGC